MERTERREIIIPAGTAAGTIIPLDNIALDSNYPHVKGMAVIVDGPTEDFRIGLDNNGKTVIDDLDYKLFNVTNTPVNERFYELDLSTGITGSLFGAKACRETER